MKTCICTFSANIRGLPNHIFKTGLFLVLILVSACGSHGTSSSQSGGISFTLKNPSAHSQAAFSQAATFACARHDIQSVEARVEDAQGAIVASGGPWPCDTGEATLENVPEGENYTVIVSMMNSSGTVVFQGSASGITVLAGYTTDAGSISLGYANHPPVLTVPSDVQHGAPSAALAFSVSASDPDGDNLSFDIGNLPINAGTGGYFTGVSFVQTSPSVYNFTWNSLQLGEYKILIRVTDDGIPRMSTTQWVTIQGYDSDPSVLDGYYLPILDPIPLPSPITINNPVQFTVTGTDPNSDHTLFLSVQTIPGKTPVTNYSFSMESQIFTWTPTTNGNYWLRFVATTNYGTIRTDYEDVLFTVGDINRPPRLDTLGNKKFQYNELHQFVVTASDPEYDLITYTAYYLSAAGAPLQPVSTIGASFDPATQVFSWTPSEAYVGDTVTVRFRASDDSGEYDVQDVDISVVNE